MPTRRTMLLFVIVVLIIGIIPQHTVSDTTDIELTSQFTLSEFDSEWLFVSAFDSSDTAWTESGASPYLGDNTDYIYVSTDALTEGWFSFPDTSLTGTITVNISVYAKNDDGAGNDHIEVWTDYTGGSGSDLGDCNCDTSYAWFTFAIGDLTASQVNDLRVKFVSDMVTQPDDVYIERVKIGLIAEVSEGDTYYITINEIIGFSDTPTTKVNLSTTLYEIITISDDGTTSISLHLLLFEIITIVESYLVQISEGGAEYSIIIYEVIGVISDISTKISVILGLNEIISIVGSVQVILNPVSIFTLIIYEIISVGTVDLGDLEQLNIFYELFLSTNFWGLFGPFGIIIVGLALGASRKYRPVCGLWLIFELFVMAQYFTRLIVQPAYWWQILILFLGVMITLFQLFDR